MSDQGVATVTVLAGKYGFPASGVARGVKVSQRVEVDIQIGYFLAGQRRDLDASRCHGAPHPGAVVPHRGRQGGGRKVARGTAGQVRRPTAAYSGDRVTKYALAFPQRLGAPLSVAVLGFEGRWAKEETQQHKRADHAGPVLASPRTRVQAAPRLKKRVCGSSQKPTDPRRNRTSATRRSKNLGAKKGSPAAPAADSTSSGDFRR